MGTTESFIPSPPLLNPIELNLYIRNAANKSRAGVFIKFNGPTNLRNINQCCVLKISYKMIVTPAQAGVQFKDAWISACAGMTGR